MSNLHCSRRCRVRCKRDHSIANSSSSRRDHSVCQILSARGVSPEKGGDESAQRGRSLISTFALF